MNFSAIHKMGLVLALFTASSYAGWTNLQHISAIVANGDKSVHIYTLENGAKWGLSGCAEPEYMRITSTTPGLNQMLAALIAAKSTGALVAFEYTDPCGGNSLITGTVKIQ